MHMCKCDIDGRFLEPGLTLSSHPVGNGCNRLTNCSNMNYSDVSAIRILCFYNLTLLT